MNKGSPVGVKLCLKIVVNELELVNELANNELGSLSSTVHIIIKGF